MAGGGYQGGMGGQLPSGIGQPMMQMPGQGQIPPVATPGGKAGAGRWGGQIPPSQPFAPPPAPPMPNPVPTNAPTDTFNSGMSEFERLLAQKGLGMPRLSDRRGGGDSRGAPGRGGGLAGDYGGGHT